MGHLGCGYSLNGWGQLWQRKLLFRLEICSKNAGLQGSTLSGHRMTTGFSPFELPTCGLLQRGRDHSPPKACFIWGAQLFGWLSKYYEYTVAKQNNEYTVAKQNGGGAEWVKLFITLTKGMGEPTYGLLLSLIASWHSRLVQHVLHRRFFAGYSGLYHQKWLLFDCKISTNPIFCY